MNLYDILLARCICSNKSEESIVATPLEVTENGEYEAEEGYAYNPVTVNVSSDFSIAEVTVIGHPSPDEPLWLPIIYTEEDGWPISAIYMDPLEIPGIFRVPLFKNHLVVPMSIVPSLSGNATYDSDEALIVITGDCTITFSDGT